jgi:hypothetical protein
MPIGTTAAGVRFEYSGSLVAGLTVLFYSSALKIKPEIVFTIRQEITNGSQVLMGANRKPLVTDSVGETLTQKYGVSPQAMNCVLPLPIEECFRAVSDRNPFVFHRERDSIARAISAVS